MRHLFIFTVLFALFTSACGDDVSSVTTDDPGTGGDAGTSPSIAGDWILKSLSVDGSAVALPDGELEITIELGQISGNLGCNSFFGEIDAAEDGALAVGGLGQTEMACEDAARMDFEFTYGQALSSATAWAVDPARLTLSGETVGVVYAQAPPPVHQPLPRTMWHFDTIYEGSGPEKSASNRADMEGVTLTITDGVASLVGPDCSGVVSSVEFDEGTEGSFDVTEPGDIDNSSACAIVGLAAAAMNESSGFMIDENRLTFIGVDGETVGFSAPQ